MLISLVVSTVDSDHMASSPNFTGLLPGANWGEEKAFFTSYLTLKRPVKIGILNGSQHRLGRSDRAALVLRSRCARQRTRAPRSGALWCGQLVAKKGKIARLPACLIGGEVDSSTKNDRI